MRIINVIPSVNPEFGGTVECVRQLHPFMVNKGCEWEVVTFDEPEADWVVHSPFVVHALGAGHTPYQLNRKLTPWLKSKLSSYDAAIIHGIWTYHSFGAWRALHSNLPYFVYPHGMLDPYFKKAFPLKHLKKLLFWYWSDYRVLRDASSVCFTCEEERLLARQSFSKYRCREAVVGLGTAWPPDNGEEQRTAFLEKFPHLINKPFLLFLARIHPKKGVDILIDAVADCHKRGKLPNDFHLVIAGPDNIGWQDELEKKAAAHKLTSLITWAGMLHGDVKWGSLRCAEAFVLPSHQENFGISVAEALACGVVPLISNKVNIWQEIVASEAGFVAADTREGTVTLIEQWLALSDNQRAKMREKARACFSSKFHMEVAAQRLLDCIATQS